MRPSLGGKFAMFGVRHGPGHGQLSRLQDLLETLVANHGEQVAVWMQPPVLLADDELIGDEPHDAADLVLKPRTQPRMAALSALYEPLCFLLVGGWWLLLCRLWQFCVLAMLSNGAMSTGVHHDVHSGWSMRVGSPWSWTRT